MTYARLNMSKIIRLESFIEPYSNIVRAKSIYLSNILKNLKYFQNFSIHLQVSVKYLEFFHQYNFSHREKIENKRKGCKSKNKKFIFSKLERTMKNDLIHCFTLIFL